MANIILRDASSIVAPGATVKNLPLTNNEVDNNFSNLSISIGLTSSLTTTIKSNVVYAINELVSNISSGNASVTSRLTNLESNVSILFANDANTALLSDVVNVNSNVAVTNSNIGVISNLLTTSKANVVNAINEIKNQVANGTISGVVISNSTWDGNIISVAKGGTGASDAANARINLSLGTISTQNANSVSITGGTINSATSINVSANITAPYFIGDGSGLSNISGSGSGAFNTAISNSIGASIGTSLANVYVAPSTANTRYVVHSIHVTNINGLVLANVSGNFNGTTYANVAIGKTIPVPAGSAVELLKKPKVLNPGDYIQMESDTASALHATIIVERVSTALHFGSGMDLTTASVYTDMFVANANSVIESILLANDDGVFDVKARVVWTDGSNNIQGYYCYDLIVPADATIELLDQPKFLESGSKVRIYTNVGGRLESIIAGKAIGS